VAKLKAFTWSYWGWGSESKHFVRAVDWLEKKRGFLSPVFVDLRLARGGRAADFKGSEFEKIVGSRRCVWMPRLGNKRIATKKGKRIQIADPSAAETLLDLIIEKAKGRRRIVMFCACEQPLLKCDDGLPSCHRVEVASLLLKAAKKRGLKLELSEWPGGAPTTVRMKADEFPERALAGDARYIPIGSVGARMSPLAALGWGSSIRFDTPSTFWRVLVGPAPVGKHQWRLQVFPEADFNGRMTVRQRRQALLDAGYGPRSVS